MKTVFSLLLVAAAMLGSFTQPSWAGPTPSKYALIIAVADYPAEGRWPDISSDNDVALIRGALLRQGFEAQNIRVVMDQEASKKLLVKEFEALTQKVSPGDVVVIHYSGHGQQIQDDNGDELDGWDEALIPWDAQIRWSDKYQGENHLRDDEIQVLTDNLRTRLGPQGNVLLVLDACHSGTASRGLAISRGTVEQFSQKGYNPEARADAGTYGDIAASEAQKMSPMVTMSGASQHELNYEYYDQEKDTSYGSLSYAFSRAITEADKNTTYRSLFDMIKVNMSTIAPRQSPQVEGDVDRELFGGNVVEAKPYFMVTDFYDNQNVQINAGNLVGIYEGSEVAFYPIGTPNPQAASPKATGKVTYASLIESDIALDQEMPETDIRSSWVFVTRQNYGDNDVNVKLDVADNAELKQKLLAELKTMPKVKIVDQNPDLLVEVNNKFTRGNNLHIITRDENELYFTTMGNQEVDKVVTEVKDKISQYIQVNLLKKIEVKDEEMDVSFEIIPVTYRMMGRTPVVDQRLDLNDFRNEGNELEFNETNYFVIKVKNNGYKTAYYQILDIRPDNQVTLLYPDPVKDKRPASEFVIGPGEETELKSIFFFTEPYGNEYIKLIATDKPIDLRSIVTTRGADTRGPGDMSPFEELLQQSFSGTRAGSLGVPPGSATVYTVPIKVVAKE